MRQHSVMKLFVNIIFNSYDSFSCEKMFVAIDSESRRLQVMERSSCGLAQPPKGVSKHASAKLNPKVVNQLTYAYLGVSIRLIESKICIVSLGQNFPKHETGIGKKF